MALLNRFSKLNDRGETGVFTFIVTKSVTRDLHRDATTKDFCFGYHRWALSFQRLSERTLGVHLLLRNPSPTTSCVVDFTLTILNRHHFSLNEVYSKLQAKFTITNPMQGVSRWIQISDLMDRHFSNETGEFLFELSLSNMSTIFECDIQLSSSLISQYKCTLKNGSGDLINLETSCFTFGSFEWSLTVVPLVLAGPAGTPAQAGAAQAGEPGCPSSSSSSSASNGSAHQVQAAAAAAAQEGGAPEPVCRVYLNRLSGLECLCRVKYRVILGHHNHAGAGSSAGYVDSRLLDQMSDTGGRIRGHQFRQANLLELASSRQAQPQQPQQSTVAGQAPAGKLASGGAGACPTNAGADLRVHIEMFCANTVSEALVPVQLGQLQQARQPAGAANPTAGSLAAGESRQVSNCSDRNKQSWCIECDASEQESLRLKLFFLDLKSVPRNHIRYISWIAYIVNRREQRSPRDYIQVKNAPHSNYYLQDGIDLGTIMDTEIPLKELTSLASAADGHSGAAAGSQASPAHPSQPQQLLVHIEWVDSLLLFSHLYGNYDALATIQRHQIGRELAALQVELDTLDRKYVHCRGSLNKLLTGRSPESPPPSTSPQAAPARPLGRRGARHSEQLAAGLPQALAGGLSLGARHSDELEPLGAPEPAGGLALAGAAGPKQPAMAMDERLKLSSSTPPGRRRLPVHPVAMDHSPSRRRNSSAPRALDLQAQEQSAGQHIPARLLPGSQLLFAGERADADPSGAASLGPSGAIVHPAHAELYPASEHYPAAASLGPVSAGRVQQLLEPAFDTPADTYAAPFAPRGQRLGRKPPNQEPGEALRLYAHLPAAGPICYEHLESPQQRHHNPALAMSPGAFHPAHHRGLQEPQERQPPRQLRLHRQQQQQEAQYQQHQAEHQYQKQYSWL